MEYGSGLDRATETEFRCNALVGAAEKGETGNCRLNFEFTNWARTTTSASTDYGEYGYALVWAPEDEGSFGAECEENNRDTGHEWGFVYWESLEGDIKFTDSCVTH